MVVGVTQASLDSPGLVAAWRLWTGVWSVSPLLVLVEGWAFFMVFSSTHGGLELEGDVLPPRRSLALPASPVLCSPVPGQLCILLVCRLAQTMGLFFE